MNRYPEYYSTCSTEIAVAACYDAELSVRANLRQVLSRLGLQADETQENTLLELIHRSNDRKQK